VGFSGFSVIGSDGVQQNLASEWFDGRLNGLYTGRARLVNRTSYS
jgi:hypothetical protein